MLDGGHSGGPESLMMFGRRTLCGQLFYQNLLVVTLVSLGGHELLVHFHLLSGLYLLPLMENHQLLVRLLRLGTNSLLHLVDASPLSIHRLAHLLSQMAHSHFRRVLRHRDVNRLGVYIFLGPGPV
ncbi:hypothetical protein B5M09_007401 [Aphanomyces astaci]|uniref:Uncharacterized protein n=1 Tax=Aphanomyces astaci TaxID=112090 RepID=A0A3R7WDL3_APHAT|nr:hypothetical protein B5M09_007401 [Aphanomyces astaci]